MICAVCHKRIPAMYSVSAARICDGYVCHECRCFVPYGFPFSIVSAQKLTEGIKENKAMAEKFDASSVLGDLYLDGFNRMFCVSRESVKRGKEKGKPKHFGDIYHITDVNGIGLVCTNVRNVGTPGRDSIICDIKLIVRNEKDTKEYIVASGIKCSFSYEGNKIDWNEPGQVSVARNILFQMADGECVRLKQKLSEMKEAAEEINFRKEMKEKTEAEKTEEWARGILFIEKDVPLTKSLIKKQRNMLVKTYHPDMGNDVAYGGTDTGIIEMINAAYGELERRITKWQEN